MDRRYDHTDRRYDYTDRRYDYTDMRYDHTDRRCDHTVKMDRTSHNVTNLTNIWDVCFFEFTYFPNY